MPSAAESSASRRNSYRWLIALIVIAAVLPYVRAAFFPYVFDDRAIIRANPDIRGWSSLFTVWLKPYWHGAADAGLYRPAFVALLAAVWNLGARVPFWFHLVPIGLHALTTVAVWHMLRRAAPILPATLAALWFAVLPVHIEAVANVANSSEVLVGVWCCGLALFLARVDRNVAADRTVPWTAALCAGAIFLMTFLSKESGVVAPLAAAVWVWGWRSPTTAPQSEQFPPRAFFHRWWRVVAAYLAVVVVVFALRRVVLGGFMGAPVAPGLVGLSAWQRVWAMLGLGPLIARILVWPRMLNPEYGPTTLEHVGPSWPAAVTLAAIAMALGFAIARARRGDRRLLAALGWFAFTFGPASNVLAPTPQILTERTLYGPSIALAFVGALALAALLDRIRTFELIGPVRSLAAAAALMLIVATGVRCVRASGAWGSNDAVFRQMIAADPAGYRGYWKLAAHAKSRNRFDESLALYERAYRLYPRDRQLVADFAQALLDRHQPLRAASVARGLMAWPDLRRSSNVVALYLNALGQAYGADSVIASGRVLFEEERVATAALFVGAAHEARGETEAAAASYRAGLRLSPGDTSLQHRADALRQAGLR